MGIQDVIRWLLPKDDHFYGFLEQQMEAAHEGALALAQAGTASQRSKNLNEVEHKGDSVVHEMEEALAKTYVTPIDREDLHRLSRSLDDILDLTNGAARAADLLGQEEPTPPMRALAELLVKCTAVLSEAVPLLRKHKYDEIVLKAREVKELEKEADRIYRKAVHALFHDEAVEAKQLIREKTILDDVEQAIDACDRLANRLSNLAVKNG
jgi:predicted phosphate transport protein (TIGR00153 family)